MRNRNDRINRDAMRKADRMQVVWYNGETIGTVATMDREFAKDVANAYARMCDRQEHQSDGYKFPEDNGNR